MAITERDHTANPFVPVARKPKKALPPPFGLYQTALGKKFVMALTGLGLIGFVIFHMLGNMKLYLGSEEINIYGESLRDLGKGLVPRTHLLWLLRFGLIAMFVLHIHAGYSLTLLSRKSRALKYQQKQKFTAANFASRSMRHTGTIVLLYLVFHLADLTWGVTDDDWVRGDVYNNTIKSFQRVPVAIIYIIANIAVAVHLFHGVRSMMTTLNLNKIKMVPQVAAASIAGLILVGNLSFPLAVQFGIVEFDDELRQEVIELNEGSEEANS